MVFQRGPNAWNDVPFLVLPHMLPSFHTALVAAIFGEGFTILGDWIAFIKPGPTPGLRS